MALTEQEKQKVTELKGKGYNLKEVTSYLGGLRTNKTSSVAIKESIREKGVSKEQKINNLMQTNDSPRSFRDTQQFQALQRDSQDTMGDLRETVQGIGGALQGAGEGIHDKFTDPDLTSAEKVVGGGADLLGGVTNAVFAQPVIGAAKTLLSGDQEEALGEKAQEVGESIANSETYKDVSFWYESQPEGVQRQVDNVLSYGGSLLDLIGVRGSTNLTRSGLTKIDDYIKSLDNNVGNTSPVGQTSSIPKPDSSALSPVVGNTSNITEEAIRNAKPPVLTPEDFTDPTLREQARLRMEAETNAPELSFAEKSVGIGKAEKAQIVGKTERMQDYIDVASRKNVTKDAPSVMEFGGDQVRNATVEMETILNTKGGDIGRTREKLSSIKAPVDSVATIENTILQQLDNLGLRVNDSGQVVRKPGVVTKVGTQADVRTLQELLDEFRIVKQSPTLTNMLDYRNLVQKNIDFGKSAREVSDSLNAPSSAIRRVIKEEADSLVGRTGANDLKEYSNFIEAYNEIKGFTDKKAGGEYLLRVLESGRGGEARQVVNTIKKHTGIDLQDDATMMKLVSELVADADQQTLFRQQITGAGLDTARILSGDPSSIVGRVGNFVMDKLTDPENVLINATKKKVPTPNREGGFIRIGKDSPEGKSSPSTKVNQSVSSTNNTTLLNEAKKYKSADEFVENTTTKVFHGTNDVFDTFDPKKGAQGGIWFTDSKNTITKGESGAQGVKNIMERHLDNDIKIGGWDEYEKMTIDEMVRDGFSGVKLPNTLQDGTTYNDFFLFNNKNIKTKAQLTDIWNKANK
jgi:hypothetical protein